MTDVLKNPPARDRARGSRGNQPDIVDLCSINSFPASDAPPWTLGRANRGSHLNVADTTQQIADPASRSAVLGHK